MYIMFDMAPRMITMVENISHNFLLVTMLIGGWFIVAHVLRTFYGRGK